MSSAIGFEIPTIIIAIVFVVHLARSRYSRRHHPNYRVGTRYHRHFYRGLPFVPDFQRCHMTLARWREKKRKIRSTKFDTEVCDERHSCSGPCSFRASRSWERCRRAVCCGEHLSTPYAGSSCRLGVLSRTVILFSVRMIESRTCDAMYIATVICMSNELPNNALIKNIRTDVTDCKQSVFFQRRFLFKIWRRQFTGFKWLEIISVSHEFNF